MKKSNASSFGNNYYFCCPQKGCRMELTKTSGKMMCLNPACRATFPKKNFSCTCLFPDCENIAAAVCLTSSGVWESRCNLHLDDTAVRVCKRRRKFSRKVTEKQARIAEANRTRGERIIHKGEFPGQHIS